MPEFGEFWRRKIRTLVDRVDLDRDGAVTWKDFENVCDRYAQISGVSAAKEQQMRAAHVTAQQPAALCPSLNLCASSPCQHGGTCSRAGYRNAFYTCTCAPLFTGRNCETFFCDQQAKQGCPSAGYTIPALGGKGVFCENSNGTTWLVFQRRQDGSVDFSGNWTMYEQGFGDPTLEFWMGNLYLAQLSTQTIWLLRVDLTNPAGVTAYSQFDNFNVGANTTFYKLNSIGAYTGNGTDGLTAHVGMEFSTYDRDRDALSTFNCAATYHSGWWFNACHPSNLNGHYNDTTLWMGPVWSTWRSATIPMIRTQMKIRPAA